MKEVSHDEVGVQPQRGAFMRFAAAVGLANLGDGIAVVAWAWTASLLTRDPFWIAVLPATLRIPWVLFSLPSGILADRLDRRQLIVACDLARAVAYLLAALALIVEYSPKMPPTHGVEVFGLYGILLILGFIIGCAEVARDNAAQSMLPSLVPRDELERSNGHLQSVETVGNSMAGPAIGSFLIAMLLPLPFFAIALALLIAARLTSSLSGHFQPKTSAVLNWRTELMEGFRFVFRHPMLRVLVLITGFWTFFSEMALIALVLHVQENLDAGAMTYGLILATGAIGGVVGGLAVAPLMRVVSKARIAQWTCISATPLFLLIAFASGPVTVSVAMFFFYLTGIVWNTLSISYRQKIVPNEVMGRVNSVYRLFAWGMMPLGFVISGLVVNVTSDFFSRQEALISPFFVAAAGILVLTLFSWRALAKGFAPVEASL